MNEFKRPRLNAVTCVPDPLHTSDPKSEEYNSTPK